MRLCKSTTKTGEMDKTVQCMKMRGHKGDHYASIKAVIEWRNDYADEPEEKDDY